MRVLAGEVVNKTSSRSYLSSVVLKHRRQAMERELWKQLYLVVVGLDNSWTNGFYRASEIVVVFLWAVVHDRPTSWACDRRNWGLVDIPAILPSQSTMSRRLRTAQIRKLLDETEAALGGSPRQWWLQWMDSKPLAVGSYSKDPDARYGRAAKGFARGYKLHSYRVVARCLRSGASNR